MGALKSPETLTFKRVPKITVSGMMLGKLWEGGEAWKQFSFDVDMAVESSLVELSHGEEEWDGEIHIDDVQHKFPHKDGDFDGVDYFVYTVHQHYQVQKTEAVEQLEAQAGDVFLETMVGLGQFILKSVVTVHGRHKHDSQYGVVPCSPEEASVVMTKLYEAQGGCYVAGDS